MNEGQWAWIFIFDHSQWPSRVRLKMLSNVSGMRFFEISAGLVIPSRTTIIRRLPHTSVQKSGGNFIRRTMLFVSLHRCNRLQGFNCCTAEWWTSSRPMSRYNMAQFECGLDTIHSHFVDGRDMRNGATDSQNSHMSRYGQVGNILMVQASERSHWRLSKRSPFGRLTFDQRIRRWRIANSQSNIDSS